MTKTLSIIELENKAADVLSKASNINHSVGGTGGSNAFYGWVLADGTHRSVEYPCHASMKYGAGAKVIYSKYKRQSLVPEKESKVYLDWLLKYSPWKAYCKANIQFVNEGFISSTLDKAPANLQHNFLVASRMVSEWGLAIRTWYWLVHEQKIDPNVAFFFLSVLSSPGEGWPIRPETKRIYLVNMNTYDWPIDHATSDWTYFRNFCNGKTENLIQPYGVNPQYKPVNRIWGTNESGNGKKGFHKYLEETYKGDIKSEAGLFSKGINNVWQCNLNQMIDIMRNETEKVYA